MLCSNFENQEFTNNEWPGIDTGHTDIQSCNLRLQSQIFALLELDHTNLTLCIKQLVFTKSLGQRLFKRSTQWSGVQKQWFIRACKLGNTGRLLEDLGFKCGRSTDHSCSYSHLRLPLEDSISLFILFVSLTRWLLNRIRLTDSFSRLCKTIWCLTYFPPSRSKRRRKKQSRAKQNNQKIMSFCFSFVGFSLSTLWYEGRYI